MKTFPASWACHTHNCALHPQGLFRIVRTRLQNLTNSGFRTRQNCGFFVSVLHRSFRMATGFYRFVMVGRARNITPARGITPAVCLRFLNVPTALTRWQPLNLASSKVFLYAGSASAKTGVMIGVMFQSRCVTPHLLRFFCAHRLFRCSFAQDFVMAGYTGASSDAPLPRWWYANPVYSCRPYWRKSGSIPFI